jgi:transposase
MNVDTDCPEIITTGTEAATSTHTSDRKSARSQRIELITRGERRRRWSLEEKQAIVAESLTPNASLTAVARRHEIGTGLLYAWRHRLLGRRSGEAAAGFARVDVMSEPHRLTGPVIAAPVQRSGLIEIVLPGGISVRVDAQVDDRALRRVLTALRG